MTKEITKANILQEVQDKFRLRDFENERFLFSELVLPTYDIGPHVKNWVTVESRKAISANGTLGFFNVPGDEEWKVRRIDVIHETGANFDIDQVLFYDSATKHQYLFFDTTSPITSGTVAIFTPTQDIPMKYTNLSSIRINVSNFVAGGYVSISILKEVEIVR